MSINLPRKGFPGPFFLTISCESMEQALDIERHIKRMKSKVYIRNMDKYPEMIEKLLASHPTDLFPHYF